VAGSVYEGLIIRRNEIHDTGGTGEGMYLGCNDAECVVHDSVIERNYVHHTNGATVSQGDGIELKIGSYGNVIRDNVIHDTGYPCILLYGSGGGAVNVVERNAMWGCGDHGIQVAADAIVRNNLILSPVAADGIHSQVHQGATPGNLQISHNTVVVANDAIRIDAPDASVAIANNALYSQLGSALELAGETSYYTLAGNVTAGDVTTDLVDADFAGTGHDAFPAPGSSLIGAGDAAHVAIDDFDGTLREGQADVGAYRYAPAGNPGWVVSATFKDEMAIRGGAGGDPGPATGSGGATGGVPATAGAAATDAPADEDGACSCRTARDPRPGSGALGIALTALLCSRRRRLTRRDRI
jgi:hypothetical protein